MTLDVAAGTGVTTSEEVLVDWPLLARLAGPADLVHLTQREMVALAAEIRRFLIAKVCATGGHLGVNLGVVELTIALHRVFESPRDVLLFDTGHQSYVHKILTGRAAGFGSLRVAGGLSGYSSRAESRHDWIESSHASTALSYADGFAKAFQLQGARERRVVAVIGDGAMTGGLAWEGLNNLTAITAVDRPVIVVLNDNNRSYDPTVGGIARHLAALRSGTATGNLFTQLGLDYLGPVDGHDIAALQTAFEAARDRGRPVLVHCVTVKGKGFPPAESDETDQMHAVGVVDAATGRPIGTPKKSWTSVFAEEIALIGKARSDVVAITAAMLQPVGLKNMADSCGDRVFDVGIAEQHAVCSATALAMAGLHPVVCIYATFLSRAYDQILMDAALHRQPVTIVLDRAGVTGPDGPSHHGMWDTALMATIPGMRAAAPRDAARLRELLHEAVGHTDGPTVIRFPKAGVGPDLDAITRMDGIDLLHRTPHRNLDVLLIAAGAMAGPCLHAATLLDEQGLGVTVADPRWITPVNPALVHLVARHRLAVTVEDATRTGGMGCAVQAACAAITTPIHILGLAPEFLDHGERGDLLATAGLDGPGIARAVLNTAMLASIERELP